MSRMKDQGQSTRTWISGLAITLTTIVTYMAFWRLAPTVTFVIGCASLVAFAIALWVAGGSIKKDQSEEK
jgi:hypothetical protein